MPMTKNDIHWHFLALKTEQNRTVFCICCFHLTLPVLVGEPHSLNKMCSSRLMHIVETKCVIKVNAHSGNKVLLDQG